MAAMLVGALALAGCSAPEKQVVKNDGDGPTVTSVEDERPSPASSVSPPIALKVPRVHPPRKIKDVPPEYPEDLKARGVQGIVVLEITIGRTGEVSRARVVKGIAGFEKAATDAAMQWKYEPPLLGNKPVAITMLVPVRLVIP